MQALFAADELDVAQRLGKSELERQIALLELLSPDTLSRLVSRSTTDQIEAQALRLEALTQARVLTNGLKGGVLGLAGQISIAETLRIEGTSGIEYMRALSAPTEVPLLCLMTPDSVAA